MTDRMGKIASRIVTSMTETQAEDWQDSVHSMISRLNDLAADLKDGELPDVASVERQLGWIKKDQANLSGDMDREAEGLVKEVMGILGDIQSEMREQVNQENQRRSRCKGLAGKVLAVALKFRKMETII